MGLSAERARADAHAGNARTIVDVLRRRAEARPEAAGFTFRSIAGPGTAPLTLGALDERARAIAAMLLDQGLRGERALLLYPAGLEFVEAFFGCLYAGVIAVPAPAPRPNRTLERLAAIAADAAPRAALAPAGQVARARDTASPHAGLAGLRWLATDTAPGASRPALADVRPRADSIAYLQYTSGSTSEPKGVVISHENLLANSESIRRGFRHGRRSRSLTWLPHFHDMGLVDGVVQPVYSGFPAVLMSPAAFLQDPVTWLEAIAQHAITHTGGPNFAYDLCARRVEPDPARLDLRSWEVAYSGAEPVRADTIEMFASRFERCGFRRRAFYPAYGLAEATLKVSGGRRGDGPRVVRVSRAALEAGRAVDDPEGIDLVGVGRAGPRTRLEIVEAGTGRARGEDEVGEVWVAGPGVALGYWNRPEESEETFGARRARGRSRFLRTGDLGFLRGGELFVTGRIKDLVIVRGRNIYPQDVERTAESRCAALRPGCGAAFGVEVCGEERLVLVHEADRRAEGDLAPAFASIRAAIVEEHEADPWAIVLVKPGGVPRTSSGKVRRAACRTAFLEGSLAELARWQAPSTAPGAVGADALGGRAAEDGLRAWITALVAESLGVPAGSIDADEPLARYGLDSLRALELAHAIGRRVGAAVPQAERWATSSLSAVLSQVQGAVPEVPGPARGPQVDPAECALSAGQQALWFLHQLDPSSPAYTITSALRLDGPLDEPSLERALRALVARHASLRARIAAEGGAARQRFDVAFETMLSRSDLRGVADGDLPSRLADEACRPFDLERGPLLRVSLLRTDRGLILLLAAHHLVADLWSLSVALSDLQALYAAEVGAGPAPVAPAPHPAAYVLRQGALIDGPEGERQLAFWRERLAGEPPALDLPADRPRPAVQTFRGGARTLHIEASLAGALRGLARSRGVTLYMLLLAAYQAYLRRVTGQDDLLIGSPVSGRASPDLAGLVGYLINTVVLRADLSNDPTFDDLLRATRDGVAAALRRQDYPFAALVKRLAPRRDPSRSALFDTMFDLHAAGEVVRGDLAAAVPGARASFAGGVEAQAVPVERRAAQFDLSVTVVDGGRDLAVELEYNADLFDAATVDRLARGYATLLAGVAADPSARVSRLPLLGPAERAAALRDANARPEPAPVVCVHRLFEREAARRPDAVAARHAGAAITYAELNRRANALARRLRAAGVAPESRVATCIEKSLDLIVALLGVLKAGGAYVIVEPSLPAARRALLVADSGARVVLARAGQRVEAAPGVALMDETAWSAPAPSSDGEDLEHGASPGNLAYVVYTSGTTGIPKGVGVTHANLAGAYRAWERVYDLRSLAAHLQVASPGFDVFSGDLVRALGSGGALVLCDKEVLLDPPELAALARAHRVEFAEFVPAALRELAVHLVRSAERIDSLRLVVVGSDAWTMADYALFREAFGPRARLMNSYGVTEATIDSTLEVALEEEAGGGWRAAPAIGRPLANTAAHVLDERLEPAPAGVRGELYLGGPAVSRGYIGRPDLTAERFLPDPHGEPGARLYRTGDAARRQRDGRIEFIGRTDSQVKVRGYRVEPAEIEAVLKTHPGVLACAVAARGQGAGPRLAAYVVAAPGRSGEAAPAALRAHLAERLPDSMVPSAFVTLDALPLTANGKLDRRSLPEPDWGAAAAGRGGPDAAGRAPASDTERILAGVFERVLGVPRVGTRDDFFELGGDSILTIQIVARAREAGVSLTPRMVFEHPTVEALARAAKGSAPPPAAAPAGWIGEAPLLPIQRWFFERGFAEPARWNMAVALDARGPLDPGAARGAARALLDHHDALRARFERGEGGRRQVIDPPGVRDAEVTQLSAAAGESREEAVARCADLLNRRLDLEKGPVVRFGIVGIGAEPGSTLVLVAHHLVVDGVSLRLLIEDFERAYTSAAAGAPIDLPARTLPPGRWAAALEQAVLAGRLEGVLDAWRRQAAGPLPIDLVPGEALEESTRTATVGMEEGETADLLRASATGGDRVEDLLLAALATACARRLGGRSLLVEVEGHGRDLLPELDVSRSVGWFTETRPLVLEEIDPSDAAGALEVVRRARRSAPGSGLLALRWLHPDPRVREALAVAPFPAISFNYLGRFDTTLGPDSIFERLREPASAQRSPRARRTHAIEIDAGVVDRRLSVRWSYSIAQLDASTVACAAEEFLHALRAVAASRPSPGDGAEDVLPLTPMQEGMLFHHLRAIGEDPYVSQVALDLTGEIELEALGRAWRAAAERHPALRTAFVWEGVEQPVQVVRRDAGLPVAFHERAAQEVEAIMAGARARGFDVSRAPLARVDLVRTGTRAATAIFTHHHMLLDGWSLPIVLRTVFEEYEAPLRGHAAAGHEAQGLRPYIEWLAAQDLGAAERFFRRYLAGFTSPTPLPDPFGRPDGSGGSGVVHVRAGEQVVARARSLGLTPNTVVQAAWALVLATGSGERDVVFGATSSGRPPELAGVESLVGLFINTLPVRAGVRPEARAHAWMRELQSACAELRQYEHAPLALVQRCAATPPGVDLFESLLVFENYPIDVTALGRRERFEVTGVRLHERSSYPLTVVAMYEGGLRFRGIYDRSRYDETAVRLLLLRLAAAVDGLLERPEASLGTVEAMAAGERHRVTVAFNDTGRDYPRDATIDEVFESVSRAREAEPALVFEGVSTTYGALRERARAVAAALAARGVGAETRVALAMERSPDLITAILGVLHAGGAYVPLDPASPPGRTARMLAQAGVIIAVTDGRMAVPDGAWDIVAFDRLVGAAGSPVTPEAPGPARRRAGAGGRANVMFTSGSTGEPKGIEVTHRGVLRLVLGSEYARLGPDETILLYSPVAFDASTFEIWGALLHGGRLAIAPPGIGSTSEITRVLERSGATVAWLTAGLFHVVVDEAAEALARVPQVLAGGDVLSPAHVRRLLAAGCRRVVNGYGPTETTTFACCEVLEAGDEVGDRVSIGRPIANTSVYVLDAAMRPAPIGAAGELAIGGDGVARGYAGRPDLTAERFVPDPCGPPGSRLYLSGDLARRRPDGKLDFLGRRDGQVKLRGFRVEVAEVEAALATVAGVRDAAVVARRHGSEAELVGYVVADGTAPGDSAPIRDALRRRVPGFMVPSRFVFLDALPLTPNGKVDRRALPKPGRPTGAARVGRALTLVEEAVADLWRRVLGVEPIASDDDFFTIGGHSLHATRLLAAMRRAFRVELPMAALYEATTVAGMARALVAHQPEPGHVERAARALARMRAMTEDGRRRAPAVAREERGEP